MAEGDASGRRGVGSEMDWGMEGEWIFAIGMKVVGL